MGVEGGMREIYMRWPASLYRTPAPAPPPPPPRTPARSLEAEPEVVELLNRSPRCRLISKVWDRGVNTPARIAAECGAEHLQAKAVVFMCSRIIHRVKS
jgi:hypothetical protein